MLAVSDSVWETETDRSDTKSFEQKPDPVSLLFCFNLRLVEIRGLLWRNLKFPIFLFHKSKEKKFILALTIILPFKATRFASLSKSFASQIYFNMSCCCCFLQERRTSSIQLVSHVKPLLSCVFNRQCIEQIYRFRVEWRELTRPLYNAPYWYLWNGNAG